MRTHQELGGQVPKFELGDVFLTPGAVVVLVFNDVSPYELLYRHSHGDYGELCAEDRRLNDEAITNGGRILSAYTLPDGTRIWIISEADRSVSTLLLPEEY